MAEGIKANPHFIGLVVSLSQAAIMQMGKIQNPVTKKVERNLGEAKVSIDMLEMLKEKTKGNLTEDEDRLINESLANLQLNYVEEIKKPAAESEQKKEEKKN